MWTFSGTAMPTHAACISSILSRVESFWFNKMGAPVACLSFIAPPTWSMCACVTTICLTVRLCRFTISRIRPISSPRSMTMASCVVSSPTTEQLHCNGLTGKRCRQVTALRALQKHDDNQKKTNKYVYDQNQNSKHSFLNLYSEILWCGRGDLNPHAFRRHPLKMVCLPVPPLPQMSLVL